MKAKFLALAALVLGLASCQTDPQDLDVTTGGEQAVTINVALPEEVTRATGTDSAIGGIGNVNANQYDLRYILEVYDADGTNKGELAKERIVNYTDATTTSTAFDLRLVPGRAYRFVVWADFVAEGASGQADEADLHYDTTNGLHAVQVINTQWTAIDESRDAYTGIYDVDNFSSASTIDMTLKRPFAKLRVVTDDLDEMISVRPAKVKVEYFSTNFYNTFDAFESKVVEDQFYNPEELIVNFDLDACKYRGGLDAQKGVQTLFADYFFGTEDDSVKFYFDVEFNEGNNLPQITFNTNIPVERNHLTTIYGPILTDANNVTVKIEDTFENGSEWDPEDDKYDVEVVEVRDAAGLQEAINESKENTTIVLGNNIDLDVLLNAGVLSTTHAEKEYGLLISAGKEVVLDLKGYTIYQTKVCTANYSMILNKGSLTITDSTENGEGKISFEDKGAGDPSFGWGSYTLRNEGTLVVDNGTIEHLGKQNQGNGQPNVHMYCAIFQYSGKSTINGGVISTPTYRSARLWNGEMTINGGQFVGQLWLQAVSDNANLVINGGEFTACGNDGSSVFVSNSGKAVKCSINGGLFNDKVGMSEPIACITGGTFTTAAKEDTNAALINDDYQFVEDNGLWTVVRKPDVAKIGEVGYTSLAKAVAAVEDGGTITLVADEEFTEENRTHNSGTWYDGLYYVGDKSFTIDLGGNTISQDGAVNDYLLNFKNDGAKANTITLKNGVLDAGTSAYCALATSSSNAQKITINLENIELKGNNSGGAVAKIRGGAELNVKADTVITGKNNYVGIEAAGNNTVVNIFEGVNIYQNGTSSYVGAIVGASQNATMNIYGGYGKSAKCGIIVMSTGATINVSGGEWIANNDGTVANDNNAVLVSQNNRYESSWACKSILNVTGGTFKGGYNCYGMGPGVEPDDAQINIKGGNFNADPASYVVKGYEAVEENGIYTVGKPKALAAFEAAIAQGGNVTLTSDVTLLETIEVKNNVVIDLNGKTVTAPLFSAFNSLAGGNLTIKNGKVVAYESTVRAIGGKAIIESGEYTSTGTALDSPATYRYSLDCREGGELIINGGTFKSNNGMINVGSTVTINGGKFENVVEKTLTRHFAYVSALLTINDGEFYGKANSSAGGCFFCGAASGCDIQVNGGKFTSLWTSGSVNRIFEVYFGGKINVTGGMFNTNGGIATFVTENTDEATKAAYPYVAK